MLKCANAAGVGPKLLDVTKNFLVMEFIEGKLLPEWIRDREGTETSVKICGVLEAILEQCWALDAAGLDHGQLSRAPKHIIVDENDTPRIVDFETASTHRRTSNVTSICHYLFIGSHLAREITKKHAQINKPQLMDALNTYKRQPTRRNFEKILDRSGL
jgi:putative serine/threonine protein kinase